MAACLTTDLKEKLNWKAFIYNNLEKEMWDSNMYTTVAEKVFRPDSTEMQMSIRDSYEHVDAKRLLG